MFIKDWKKEMFTIPNLLSVFRLVLIPVYVVIYLNAQEPADYFLAAAILAVSCLTDLIDGKIARHFNMISTVGKILDPVADKATQFTLIICLALKYPILWYLVALFVVKESFQLIAGGIRLRKGRMLKGALLSGKICTTVLFLSLGPSSLTCSGKHHLITFLKTPPPLVIMSLYSVYQSTNIF